MLHLSPSRAAVAAIPILLIVSALLFCVLRLLPVDPAAMSLPPNATIAEIEAKRREMGLDQPLPQQYLIWLADALHGDFGRSIQFRRECGSAGRLDPAGDHRARRGRDGDCRACSASAAACCCFASRGTLVESRSTDLGSIAAAVDPGISLGPVLLFVFGVVLHALPFTGRLSPSFARPHITGFLLLDALLIGRLDMFWSALKHMILPALRARPRLFAGDHARAALEPDRCLSRGLHPAGAAARPLRAAHPASPCAEERDPADADA